MSLPSPATTTAPQPKRTTMPRISKDEARVLTFLAAVLALAGLARLRERPPEFAPGLQAMDVATAERIVGQKVDEERRRREPLAPGEKIDPNTASAIELDRLPRVGRAMADRIVEERERGGPFRSLADMAARVPGLGPATIERLAPNLALPDGPPGGPPTRTLDPNRASAEELTTLPGIGPALAARLVAYRDSVGPFRRIEDLERVPGIGPATLRRLAPYLRIGP